MGNFAPHYRKRMIEKHLVLNDADPAVFYGVNNNNLQLLKALFPKLRIVARGRSEEHTSELQSRE